MFFKKEFQTYDEAKKEQYRPLVVKCSSFQCESKILSYLNENEYAEIAKEDRYPEIFAKKGKFEITFSFLPMGNGLMEIKILVFTNQRSGGAKKMAAAVKNELQKTFE